MRKSNRFGLAVLAAFALMACDEGATTGPNGSGEGPAAPVSLSLALSSSGGAAAPALFAAGELTLTDGSNTLVIQSAEVVVREIEFERAEELSGCDADEGEVEGEEDDSCAEFEIGPWLIALPLDGTVSKQISADVPVGTYDEIEFDVHKVGDDPADQLFLQEHPDFDGLSVRVTGTWNGSPFEYTTDMNEEQELELPTPLVIDETAGPINVTLAIDLSAWFVDGSGNLLDPETGLKDGPNEELIEDNIKGSIDGFEDDDEDGIPHHEDDDEQDD